MASMDPKSVTDCLSAEEGELPITTFSSTERAFREIRVYCHHVGNLWCEGLTFEQRSELHGVSSSSSIELVEPEGSVDRQMRSQKAMKILVDAVLTCNCFM